MPAAALVLLTFAAASPAVALECRTLAARQIGEGGPPFGVRCELEATGEVNLARSYCASAGWRRPIEREASRRDRYFSSMTVNQTEDEIRCFVADGFSKLVECLPRINDGVGGERANPGQDFGRPQGARRPAGEAAACPPGPKPPSGCPKPAYPISHRSPPACVYRAFVDTGQREIWREAAQRHASGDPALKPGEPVPSLDHVCNGPERDPIRWLTDDPGRLRALAREHPRFFRFPTSAEWLQLKDARIKDEPVLARVLRCRAGPCLLGDHPAGETVTLFSESGQRCEATSAARTDPGEGEYAGHHATWLTLGSECPGRAGYSVGLRGGAVGGYQPGGLEAVDAGALEGIRKLLEHPRFQKWRAIAAWRASAVAGSPYLVQFGLPGAPRGPVVSHLGRTSTILAVGSCAGVGYAYRIGGRQYVEVHDRECAGGATGDRIYRITGQGIVAVFSSEDHALVPALVPRTVMDQ